MVPVPAGVVVSYGNAPNAYTFGPYITTNATFEPVGGSGDRTVKYTKLTIKINGFFTQEDADAYAASLNPPLAAGLTLDGFIVMLRRKLQRHGKNLRYVNKGCGVDLDFNNPGGGIRDCKMGPHAGTLNVKTLGGAPHGSHAATFDWTVTATYQDCSTAHYNPGAGNFTDVTYRVSYDTDEAGMLTITTTGTVEIPLSLNNTGGLDHNIDEYFAAAIAPPRPGFLRKMHRQLSADRASADFTATDRQIERPCPDDVVEIDAKFKVRATSLACQNWNATLTANIRLRPDAPGIIAWFRFYALLRRRTDLAASRRDPVTGLPMNCLPPVIEMEEDLFKNSSRFTANYRIVGTNLTNIIVTSGLWRRFDAIGGGPSTDFTRWQGTLLGNSQAPLGILGTKFSTASDILIDSCGAGTPILVAPAAEEEDPEADFDESGEFDEALAGEFEPINLTSPGGDVPGGDVPGGDVMIAGGTSIAGPNDGSSSQGWGSKQVVHPESSWLDWQCSVTREIDHHQIRHKPLSGTVTTDTPYPDPLGPVDSVANDTTEPKIGFSASVPDIVQQTSSPSLTLQMRGFAIRFGFTINPPKLISFGGVAAVLKHEVVTPTTLGMPDGNKYFRLDWILTYIIPSAPSSISVPANPYLRTDGVE